MNNGILNYGGSQTICTSVGFGQGVLNYFGSQMKGYQSNCPKIVQFMSAFIYKNGSLYDPFLVVYNITCPKGHNVKNQIEQVASRYSVGNYYANFAWWNFASAMTMGQYTIVWEVTDTQFGPTIATTDSFTVYKDRIERCLASDIASTGGSNTVDGAPKQSGTCNTLGYGIGQVNNGTNFQVISGCGCS